MWIFLPPGNGCGFQMGLVLGAGISPRFFRWSSGAKCFYNAQIPNAQNLSENEWLLNEFPNLEWRECKTWSNVYHSLHRDMRDMDVAEHRGMLLWRMWDPHRRIIWTGHDCHVTRPRHSSKAPAYIPGLEVPPPSGTGSWLLRVAGCRMESFFIAETQKYLLLLQDSGRRCSRYLEIKMSETAILKYQSSKNHWILRNQPLITNH